MHEASYTMSKPISLAQQIEEVERELELRERVYEGPVRSGGMRRSVADFHMTRMRAVLATLRWLRENETAVRAAVGPKR